MLKLSDIRIRDPYILPHNRIYFLYGTINFDRNEESLFVFTSTNLEDWDEPKVIFTLPEDFWGGKPIWAPEVHKYRGKFYLFATLLGTHGLRGTQIAVSDTPDGTFTPIADCPATPFEKSCIDGSLYMENGVPYIIYSRDWPDNYIVEKDCYVGEICAVQLSEDLASPVGVPFTLFTSLDAPCSASTPTVQNYQGKTVLRYGSDGPFVSKLRDGQLFLTWSPIPARNYIVAAAVSDSIHGNWSHLDELVFDKNGGHAMFFDDFNGQKKMCIHTEADGRILILNIKEEGNMLRVK